MRLTAIPGHGNAVVKKLDAELECDTYLILQSRVDPTKLYVIDTIKEKKYRLCPLNGTLQPFLNPESLWKAPSVTPMMLKRLFDLGLLIEELEGTPRDIEFVVKGEIIYVVQHRSVNRKPPKPPSYIDRELTTALGIQTKTVIPGHLQAQTVKDFSSVLVADTLEEAQFIQGNFDLTMIKCDEPPNSHPIVNFSERAIPVFYHTEGLDPHQEGEVTAFSAQQGAIFQGPESAIVIKEGMIDHPAPIHFSYLDDLPWIPLKQEVIDQIHALMMELTADKTIQVASSSSCFSLKGVKEAVGWKTFKERVAKTPTFSEAGNKLIALIRATGREMKKSRIEGSRIEFLFYAKAFRVLLTDGKFSVYSLNEALEPIVDFEETSSSRLSKEVVIATLEQQTQKEWISFLHTIDQSAHPEQINALLHLLETLGNLRPLWITFYFCPTHHLSPLDRLAALLDQIDNRSLDFLNRIKHQNLSSFLQQEFIDQFKESRPLTKVMILSYLAQAVDDYDKQLKALQRSSLPLNLRMATFKEKLLPYLTLMHRTARELVGEGKFHFPNNGRLSQYLSKIEELTELIYNLPDDEALLRTSGFSALVAQLEAGHYLSGNSPLPLKISSLWPIKTYSPVLECYTKSSSLLSKKRPSLLLLRRRWERFNALVTSV